MKSPNNIIKIGHIVVYRTIPIELLSLLKVGFGKPFSLQPSRG